MTSYTLNNWDGGASMSNADQQAPQSSVGNVGTTHNTWNFIRNDVGKSVDTLETQEMDDVDPERKETFAIFGPLNEAEFNNTRLNQPIVPAPRISAIDKVPLAVSVNTESSADAHTADVNDASVAKQIQPDIPTFVPVLTSALHSPGARKEPSGSTPGPMLTRLFQSGNAAPGSPTLVRAPVVGAFIGIGLRSGLEAEKGKETEADNMSLPTTDAPGEDEDDDVMVVEGDLLNFSPSKTDSYISTHADNTPSRNHAAGSTQQQQQQRALSKPLAHTSLFTPPPSVGSHSGRMSSCPPADRLFTPEPQPRPSRLPLHEARAESDDDDVVIVTHRPFPLSAPNKTTSANGKRKAAEKASDEVRPRSKKRRVMAYVQVPPLKRPRSDYVMYGISGSSSASAGAGRPGFVKKSRAILGPPPSAAGPSRLPSSSTNINKAPRKGVPLTKKPNLQTSVRLSGRNGYSSDSRGRNVGLSLGEALQASFNHNERVGTLAPGQVTGAVTGKKGKGKGKGRAREQDSDSESESDEEEDGRGNNRRRLMAAPATPARPAPARIQPSGGVGYGYSHGTRRPPPSTDSTTTATTTSGSVAIVAWQRTPTTVSTTARKKRPRADSGVDVDVYDVDAQDSDSEYHSTGRGKKKLRVDIDLTMTTSGEDIRARKVAAASRRSGRGEEEEDDEVQVLRVVKANSNAANQKPRPRPRPPPSSVSTRPPASSASMRPPPSPASRRPPASSASTRPLANLSQPALSSKNKGKPIAKPTVASGLANPLTSKSRSKDKAKALSSPFSISSSSLKPSLQRATGKENAHAFKSSESTMSKLKAEGRVLYSFNASTDVVRLVLGDVDPISRDVLGSNLRRLKAEFGKDFHRGLPSGLTKEYGQVKRREEDKRVQAPWACRPSNFSSSFSGSTTEGDEGDISLGCPVSFAPSPSSVSVKVKAKVKQGDNQRGKPAQRKAKPVEPLFTDSEDGTADVDDEDGSRLHPESELEYEIESDDVPLSGGASVVREVQPPSSASSYSSQPRTLVTPSSAPGPGSMSAPSGAAPASPQRHAPTPKQQLQPQPQQPQAPLKKIDLAAFYRKNKTATNSGRRPAGSVRSASSSAQTEAAVTVAPSPSIGRHTSQHPAQMYPYPHVAPVVATSSSMSTSLSAGPAHSLNFQQHYPVRRQVGADEDNAFAPALPSAKALGKRRAVSVDFVYSQHGRAAPSASPPPPPYTPTVLQQAFLAASNVAAGAGVGINVNLNATINHVHHHSHLHASPHQSQTPQRLLRGPNADADLFLVSPIQQSTSTGVDLGVGTSASAGLYATTYPSTLNLRDEAVLLGASQSDLAHLYSPPGLPASQGRGDDGRMLSETILDSLDLPQPEDPWETLMDADGRYTYSTVNPALIVGDDARDVLSETPLFSEDDEEAVIRPTEVQSVVEVVREQSSVRGTSPAYSSTSSSSSSSRPLMSSRSLSASATRPRPFSEQRQQSPCPSLPAPSVAVSNVDTDDGEYLPSQVKLEAVSKKRKRKNDVHDVPSQAIVPAIVEDVAIPRSVDDERNATTPDSNSSNAPLSGNARSRRRHIPRRMDDMVPTSELLSMRARRKSDSEYIPSSASVISGRGADEDETATSDAEASESDSLDRVVVVKRMALKAISSEHAEGGPPRLKATVKDRDWPSTDKVTYCHQCRNRSNRLKMPCTCGKEFCARCYAVRYPDEVFNSSLKHFGCPACLDYCNCTKCCQKRGEQYVSSSRGPPGKRFAGFTSNGKADLPPPPARAIPPPSIIPNLAGPIPETAQYWGSIYSLTTGEKLTSTFVTSDMGVDVVSGAPTVVYAPAAAAAVPSQRLKKKKTMVKGRVFVGAVQRCWGFGRHMKIRVIEPYKSSTLIRKRKESVGAWGRTSYVGNPAFLEYRLPEPEDPYYDLLEGLSPLTSLEDSSDEEADGVGDEAGMA